MANNIDIVEESSAILKKHKRGEISADFARRELSYMIAAAKTMKELRASEEAYDQFTQYNGKTDE